MLTLKTIRKPLLSANQMALNSLSTNASWEPSLENVGNTPETLNSPTSGCGDSSLWNFLGISSPFCQSSIAIKLTILVSKDFKLIEKFKVVIGSGTYLDKVALATMVTDASCLINTIEQKRVEMVSLWSYESSDFCGFSYSTG